MAKKPKILYFDLETSHSLMAAFGIFDQNIPYTNILIEWSIISVAWKWKGEKKTHSLHANVKKGSGQFADIDDKKLIQEFLKVLEEADIVVGHNIDRFDLKKFRARAIYHGLKPFKKLHTLDTLKVAKKEFAFTSNRLDYLAAFFKLKGKMSTPTGLWLDVLRGDAQAVKTMVKYNIQDVVLLEQVYDKLLPYMTTHPNMNMFTEGVDNCPNCGGNHLQKAGKRVTKMGLFQRYQCQDCGAYSRNRLKNEKRAVEIVAE